MVLPSSIIRLVIAEVREGLHSFTDASRAEPQVGNKRRGSTCLAVMASVRRQDRQTDVPIDSYVNATAIRA